MLSVFRAVFTRELRACFQTPLAYVFLSVYLLVSGLATWNMARFFDTAIAELTPFFQFQPWLLALFLPAIGMRFWSEDLRSGTADLYLTAQKSLWLIHLAKLAAGLVVLLAALLATSPYWVVVNYLGEPDNRIIALSYGWLILLGSVFLAITLIFSALTRQQVIAFVLATLSSLLLLTLGLPMVTGQLSSVLPGPLASWLQGYSLLDAFVRGQRGLVTLGDLGFALMLGGVVFYAGIHVLNLHRRIGQASRTPWGLMTLAVLILSLPLARGTLETVAGAARLDVTEDRLNTLSPSARALSQTLSEPVTLTLFYSEGIGRDYPEIRSHADRVKALLDAFVRHSNGKLILETIDPIPFSSGEDRALTAGIDAVPTEGLDPLYFGLVGKNLVEDEAVIGFLNPEQDQALEFEIASLISRLDRPKPPGLGIISGVSALDERGGNGSASRVFSALETGFETVWLGPDALNIPDDIDALLVIAPGELSAYTAYQIDQYLLREGRLIILTDPAPIMSDAGPLGDQLRDMLRHWGLSPSETALADRTLGLPVNTSGPTGPRVERQPLYPGPGKANMAADDFLVGSLQRQVNFGGAGWFTPVESESSLKARPVIWSSEEIGQIDPARLEADRLDPASIRALIAPLSDALTPPVSIVTRLSGQGTTLFAEGPPEPELPDDPVLSRIASATLADRPHLETSTSPVEIVAIGDTDFLYDAFYVHPQTGEPLADNEALLLAVLDQFAGRPQLAALRTRPQARRPMTRILDLRRAAEADYIEEQDKVEADLREIESRISGDISDADAQTRAAYMSSREKLRDLQKAFRSRIVMLEAWLRFWTIWLPAGLAILLGLGVHLIGRRSS